MIVNRIFVRDLLNDPLYDDVRNDLCFESIDRSLDIRSLDICHECSAKRIQVGEHVRRSRNKVRWKYYDDRPPDTRQVTNMDRIS